MATPVRVRFAPSPTGRLNLGGVRSALFNWLFARHHDGQFILRIEDTDRQRLVPGSAEQIQETLEWLGLTPDEGPSEGGTVGPYVQSERLEHYTKYAEQLIQSGHLYPCWCSPERLAELRQTAQANHIAFKYDRYCLNHPGDLNDPHVLRFRVPDAPQIVAWDDVVRGHIEFPIADIDDFIAVKSDGIPTYQFANVIDDHLMDISHVLRADEWLPSTPKHLLLYKALGWNPPAFAHLPAVQGIEKRGKLSKRHGAKPALDYRAEGYLPEAVVNFIALLGWNEGEGSTQEIFTREELVSKFSLERIQASPAAFDEERLNWFNGVWIRSLSLDDLLERSQGFWSEAGEKAPKEQRKAVLNLVQDRLKYLAELPELTAFFFEDPRVDPALYKSIQHADMGDIKHFLNGTSDFVDRLSDAEFGRPEKLEKRFRNELAKELGAEPAGPLFMTLRIALTGKTATPGLFETMSVLGRETVLRRLKTAQSAAQV